MRNEVVGREEKGGHLTISFVLGGFHWRLVQKKKIRSPNYLNPVLIFRSLKLKKKKKKNSYVSVVLSKKCKGKRLLTQDICSCKSAGNVHFRLGDEERRSVLTCQAKHTENIS